MPETNLTGPGAAGHDDKGSSHRCGLCAKYFSTNENLKNHFETDHSLEIKQMMDILMPRILEENSRILEEGIQRINEKVQRDLNRFTKDFTKRLENLEENIRIDLIECEEICRDRFDCLFYDNL